MKINGPFLISIVAHFPILIFLAAGLFFVASGTVKAGGVCFSRTWKLLQTNEMPKEEIQLAVMACETVRAYADMGGHANGATVVKGPTRKNPQVIVKLYKNGKFEKSCHVHINEKIIFESCTCE